MKNHSEKCASLIRFENEDMGTQDRKCDCDGYHTFNELYEHRIALWIALCKQRATHNCNRGQYHNVWRSKNHSDGEPAFGGTWFVIGMGRGKGEQITYHLPIEKWNECEFAETIEKAPEFDGHTSDDVINRLKEL